ncbi:MAG: hypothetical protein V4623_08270 [Pseudomonadota bacterium]
MHKVINLLFVVITASTAYLAYRPDLFPLSFYLALSAHIIVSLMMAVFWIKVLPLSEQMMGHRDTVYKRINDQQFAFSKFIIQWDFDRATTFIAEAPLSEILVRKYRISILIGILSIFIYGLWTALIHHEFPRYKLDILISNSSEIRTIFCCLSSYAMFSSASLLFLNLLCRAINYSNRKKAHLLSK